MGILDYNHWGPRAGSAWATAGPARPREGARLLLSDVSDAEAVAGRRTRCGLLSCDERGGGGGLVKRATDMPLHRLLSLVTSQLE